MVEEQGKKNHSEAGSKRLRQRIAKRVRHLRKSNDLTQQELADRAEIDRTYLARLETQALNVSIDVLYRLASSLDVEVTDLAAQEQPGE